MLEFIKEYIFFMVDKDTKDTIRSNVFRADHKGYRVTLHCMALYQLIAFIYYLIKYILAGEELYLINYWLSLGLAVLCLTFAVILRLCKNMKTIPGFVMIHSIMCLILIWGIAKSALNSKVSPNLVSYAYVSITLVACVTMEPWLIITDLILATTAINCIFVVAPGLTFNTEVLMESLAVLILGVLVCIITFYRRNHSLILEVEVKKLNSVLEHKAYCDELTGLWNRRYLSENMTKGLTIGNTPSGVILLDIDDFKKINDKYGHLSGDATLQKLGKILQEFECSYSVRYGGEEFLIFFQSITEDELMSIAEKIRVRVANDIFPMTDGTQRQITISLGLATAKVGISYSQMIDNADDALYYVKNHGKNQSKMAL